MYFASCSCNAVFVITQGVKSFCSIIAKKYRPNKDLTLRVFLSTIPAGSSILMSQYVICTMTHDITKSPNVQSRQMDSRIQNSITQVQLLSIWRRDKRLYWGTLCMNGRYTYHHCNCTKVDNASDSRSTHQTGP